MNCTIVLLISVMIFSGSIPALCVSARTSLMDVYCVDKYRGYVDCV